jgi:spore coat protein U-like protein
MRTKNWIARTCAVLGAVAGGVLGLQASASAALCTIGNGSLAFGSLPGLASTITLDSSGSFTVNCTVSAPYTLSLDKGTWGGSISSRLMQLSGGGATLGYQVYQDSAHTTVFGDGVTGSTKSGTGTGSAQTINVYGQIPSQNVSLTGSYSDGITITVVF